MTCIICRQEIPPGEEIFIGYMVICQDCNRDEVPGGE